MWISKILWKSFQTIIDTLLYMMPFSKLSVSMCVNLHWKQFQWHNCSHENTPPYLNQLVMLSSQRKNNASSGQEWNSVPAGNDRTPGREGPSSLRLGPAWQLAFLAELVPGSVITVMKIISTLFMCPNQNLKCFCYNSQCIGASRKNSESTLLEK